MLKNPNQVKIQKIAELKSLLNLNFVVSYYVPVLISGQLVDAAFLYSSGTASTKRTRPFAKVLFEHSNGALLEYTNAYVSDFMDGDAYPMTSQIEYALDQELTVEQIAFRIQIINENYEEICKVAFSKDLNESQKGLVDLYRCSFYQVVPKELLPFYRALSPAFFEWLDGAVS